MPYGKIFEDIFDSSLIAIGGWLPTYVMMSMVSIADKDGLVMVAPLVLYRKLGLADGTPKVSFKQFQETINYLESPDPDSRSTAQDGKRIVALSEIEEIEGNRGWLLVNYDYYRQKGSRQEVPGASTKRVQEFRKRKQEQALSHDETVVKREGNSRNGHTDTDTDTDKEHTSPSEDVKTAKAVLCPHQQILDLYHTHCPDLPRIRTWEGNRKSNLKNRFITHKNLEWWTWFFQRIHTLDFYNGRIEGKNWKANLEWIVKLNNFQKLVDKSYEQEEGD